MDKQGKEKKENNNIKQILKIQSYINKNSTNVYKKKGSKLNKIKQKIEKYSFPIKIIVILIFIFLFIVPIIKDFDNEYKKIVLKAITNEEIYITRKKHLKTEEFL